MAQTGSRDGPRANRAPRGTSLPGPVPLGSQLDKLSATSALLADGHLRLAKARHKEGVSKARARHTQGIRNAHAQGRSKKQGVATNYVWKLHKQGKRRESPSKNPM